NKEYKFYDYKYSSSPDLLQKGEPDLRFRSFLIQLHSRDKNEVAVLKTEFETIPNVLIAPIPEKKISSSTLLNEDYFNLEYNSKIYPEKIATIENVGIVQGVLLGALKVYPLEYNSTTKVLKKYTKIIIQIDLASSNNFINQNILENSHILNKPNSKPLSNKFITNKLSANKSPFANGKIFKIEITEEGIYKIDQNYLKSLGIEISTLSSIYDIKIFGSNGKKLNHSIKNLTNIEYPQLALEYVDNNQNSKLDSDDYIIFYSNGSSGWEYEKINKKFSHYLNQYSNSNFVFLKIGGDSKIKLMEKILTQGTTSGVLASTTGKLFFDEEKTNLTQSGLEWYSAPMTDNTSRIITNKLHGYIDGSQIIYNYELLSRADKNSVFNLSESNSSVASVVIPGMTSYELYGDPIGEFAKKENGSAKIIPLLTDSRSNLKLSYTANSSVAIGYINWIELFYNQQLSAVNDNLIFTSPDTSAIVEFSINGFTSNQIQIYNITNIENVKKFQNVQLQQLQGNFTFKDILTNGSIQNYWAGTSSTFKIPKIGVAIPNSNLIEETIGADFVIIAHRDFYTEANRLKNHKEQLSIQNKLKTLVIDVDTLFNEFGFGLKDPVAIRNYLLQANQTWQTKPRYALFFGDGNMDFRNILNIDKNYVPTFETDNSNIQITSYNYDDFFVMLDSINVNSVSIAHGRLTVRSSVEAKQIVDKIIRYETNPPLDEWKNLVTITADDRNINNNIDGADNEEQAERLATQFVPSSYDVKKIYIGDYPTTISASGRRKPEARSTLINQVNQGTLLLNYTGHGNSKVWAHESILTKEDVKSEFKNGNRLPLIIAATCDWGRFDEVGEQSSAEDVIVNSNGGALGVISATRAVFSGDNAIMNYKIYQYMFPINPFTPVSRIGDALLLAKNDPSSGSLDNNQKYHLLGDPTIRLAVPQYFISIDSLNGKKISSTSNDTLRALEKISISASVKNEQNNIVNNFNGTAFLTVFDSERFKTITDLGITFRFVEKGAVIFRGEHSISNGKMNAKFITPKDISYENKNGRLSIYFNNLNNDGRGFTNELIVGGTSKNIGSDKVGPKISIYFDKNDFQDGDIISENATLYVELSDSSGINATGSGIGHRIEAWIDENKESIDLTNYYRSARDNYQKGTATYQLQNLEIGKHTIKVKCWDVYNNSSEKKIEFSVTSSSTLSLSEVFNFPNPAKSSTRFTFHHNQLEPIDVEINIYTIAGRLIKKIELQTFSDRFVNIEYDCRDNDGDDLANGIYIYKLNATTIDKQLQNEAIGKLVIMK
ncbi:MAG: type IX secretion system sortase PorU, partial [Bacteroidetes bacterium]|nr:type IX secretion system sortase PorU [Bacteroidota bacterium]